MEMSADFSNATDLGNINSKPIFDFSKLPYRNLFLYSKGLIMTFYIFFLVFGVPANIINIVVYIRTRVRDNVTISFMALSLSDLVYLVFMSPFIFTYFLRFFEGLQLNVHIRWLVDHRVTSFPFYWYAFVFYETSILITVYISVVRCACVAIPFRVKSTFTARRAIYTFIVLFISTVLIRVPTFMRKRITLEFNPVSNTTRFIYKEFEDGGVSEKLNDIFNRNILNWASLLIVITCLIVMVTKLQASVKFRSSTTAAKPIQPISTHKVRQNQKRPSTGQNRLPDPRESVDGLSSDRKHATQQAESENLGSSQLQATGERTPRPTPSDQTSQTTSDKEKTSSEKGSKETQVLRCVILTSAVFVSCQIPFMAYTLARRLFTEFGDSNNGKLAGPVDRYVYLFALCSNLSTGFALANASMNIFVYYNFNSRYRHTMKALWKTKWPFGKSFNFSE